MPAKSTIHAVLDRHELVARIPKRRSRANGTPLSEGTAPNDLWCADYKGEFQLGNRSWCYPLTVTDYASRFLLLCEAMETTREEVAFVGFERLFGERGLPTGIRSDNGVPFASPNGLFNLSKLSVWWLPGVGPAVQEGVGPLRVQVPAPGRLQRPHTNIKQGINTINCVAVQLP